MAEAEGRQSRLYPLVKRKLGFGSEQIDTVIEQEAFEHYSFFIE